MHTIAVTNRKGGVAKTTTALNLGAALAAMGKRVLLIDLDAGDLTTSAGIGLDDEDNTIFEVLTEGVPISKAIKHIQMDKTGAGYDVLPADDAMANLQHELGNDPDSAYRLKRIIQKIERDYDYVLLDTPPAAFSTATINALVAANKVLIPAIPHFLSLEAISGLVETLNEVKRELNPHMEILGVLFTQYHSNSSFHKGVIEAVGEALPGKVFDTVINDNIAVAEAAANGTDLFEYVAVTPQRKNSKAVEQYQRLAEEIENREKLNGK